MATPAIISDIFGSGMYPDPGDGTIAVTHTDSPLAGRLPEGFHPSGNRPYCIVRLGADILHVALACHRDHTYLVLDLPAGPDVWAVPPWARPLSLLSWLVGLPNELADEAVRAAIQPITAAALDAWQAAFVAARASNAAWPEVYAAADAAQAAVYAATNTAHLCHVPTTSRPTRQEDMMTTTPTITDLGWDAADPSTWTLETTVDAHMGYHHTGMVERRYQTITDQALDYEPDLHAILTRDPDGDIGRDGQVAWWVDVLPAIHAAKVAQAEASPEQLVALEEDYGADYLDSADDLEIAADRSRVVTRFLAGS